MYGYVSFTEFKREFAYKHRVMFFFIGSILSIIFFWYLWSSIFSSSGQAVLNGFTLESMITYMIISTALYSFISNRIEYNIETDVRNGVISIRMIRPYNYVLFQVSKIMGTSSFGLLLTSFPIFIIGLLFFNIMLPSNLIIFLISIILGFIVSASLSILTGMWAFWTIGSIWGLRWSREVISRIASGSYIPLAFFPDWMANIANLLPFKAMYSTPLLIYIGQLTGTQLYYELLQQVFWVVFLTSMVFIVWKRAEKKVVVQGG